MANANDLLALKKRVEQAQQEASKATGALEAGMARLKKEFGCDTLEEAQSKLRRMTKETEKAQAEFEEAFSAFQKEHGAKL